MRTTDITVESFTIYSDGSGAPAKLTVNGFSIAFDYLGGLRTNRLGQQSGRESGRRRTEAIVFATERYLEMLNSQAGARWFEMNHRLYWEHGN